MAWENEQAAYGARILRASLDAAWFNHILFTHESEYDRIVATGELYISMHEFADVAPHCLITRCNFRGTFWAECAKTYSAGDISAHLITMTRNLVEYCIVYRDVGEQVRVASVQFRRTKRGGIRLHGAEDLPIPRKVVIGMLAPPEAERWVQ